jgi:hypothetical protein
MTTDHGQQTTLKLEERDGKVMARLDGAEPVAVRIVYACPMTEPGRNIGVLNEKGEAAAFVADLADLDPDSRRVAEQALGQRYFLPRITRVISANVAFGQRTIVVETDRGVRAFALKNVNRNVQRLDDDRLIIRDTCGNRYEIQSLGALDAASRDHLMLAI